MASKNIIKSATFEEFKSTINDRFAHVHGRRIQFIRNKGQVFLTNSAPPVKYSWVKLEAKQ